MVRSTSTSEMSCHPPEWVTTSRTWTVFPAFNDPETLPDAVSGEGLAATAAAGAARATAATSPMRLSPDSRAVKCPRHAAPGIVTTSRILGPARTGRKRFRITGRSARVRLCQGGSQTGQAKPLHPLEVTLGAPGHFDRLYETPCARNGQA